MQSEKYTVLGFDTSAGEYENFCLCRACIDALFTTFEQAAAAENQTWDESRST